MNNWIKWCKCKGSILTTEQMENGKDCYRCQKEHEEQFHKNNDITKDEQNGKNSA